MSSVLVINDDSVQLHLLATLLEQDQFDVQRSLSAVDALHILEAGKVFDAIVVDLHMPGMDGRQFCHFIRSQQFSGPKTIPLLVVSATHSGVDAEQMAADLGAHGFLSLPVEPSHFRNCVRNLVAGCAQPVSLGLLLIEEDLSQAEQLQYALERRGWKVSVVQTAQQAKTYLQGQLYDVVLISHELPDMTGLELLSEFKPVCPSTAWIFMTANSAPTLAVEALRSGAHAYIHKPCDSDYVIMLCEKARQELTYSGVESLLENRTMSLRDSEDRFQTLFESLPDIIVVYDRAKKIRHINVHGVHQLGWSRTDLIGKPISLICPEIASDHLPGAANGVGGRQGHWRVATFITRSGQDVEIEMMEREVVDDGSPSTLLVARDMTNRQLMEVEKEKLEQQLRQSQKMEAVGRLAAGVAHDVNNILTAIVGHASLLKARSTSEQPVWQAGDVIEQAVHRGQQLTSQLLGFARQGKHHHVPVDVHGVIREVVALLSRTVDKSISLHETLHSTQPWVVGDPNQLHQVLMNLAINACDALAEGGTLSISTANEVVEEATARHIPGMTPGESLVISVKDSGVGIAPDVQSHIFEPFFTTKEKGKGSGMGLAMVYGIVKNHHGYVGVESDRGFGTTVKVYLPCIANPVESQAAAPVSEPVSGQGHILVVDDEDVVASVAAELLEYLGYKATVASSGMEAVAYFQQYGDQVDLVLLDMVMEGMNGAECFKALRKMYPDLKVILCTGYDRNHAIQELLNRGVEGFIQKPYDLTELSQAVGQVLNGSMQSSAGNNANHEGVDEKVRTTALVGEA